MAKILADRDIKQLLGTVILNADPERINPNGIEIRLGRQVLFQSTDEEKELGPGMYLKVLPGESVTISSLEDFVLTEEAIWQNISGLRPHGPYHPNNYDDARRHHAGSDKSGFRLARHS